MRHIATVPPCISSNENKCDVICYICNIFGPSTRTNSKKCLPQKRDNVHTFLKIFFPNHDTKQQENTFETCFIEIVPVDFSLQLIEKVRLLKENVITVRIYLNSSNNPVRCIVML